MAVGLGNTEREQDLLAALADVDPDVDDAWIVAERCLTAEQVEECLHRGQADALLLAADLHRLTGERLEAFGRAGVPLVLLASDAQREHWQAFLSPSTVLLPLTALAQEVRAALLGALGVLVPAVVRGLPVTPVPADTDEQPAAVLAPSTEGAATAAARHAPQAAADRAADATVEVTADAPADAAAETDLLTVLAVASGPGSPGRTTVALSLAAALGACAPTVLVDLDFDSPSVCPRCNLDPTHGLYMVAHAEPATPREWERALAREIQPLSPRSPFGVALCGVPKPEMRGGVPVRFVKRLLEELRQRYRYVVLDTGAELLGSAGAHDTVAAVHQAAVAAADHVLLVVSADVVGLWQAQTALDRLRTRLGVDRSRLSLVVNRHDRRYHDPRQQIEWALEAGVAALVPFDHAGAERSLAAQQPLVLDTRSRAARALMDLAERVYGGRVLLPPELAAAPRLGWARPARWARWARRVTGARRASLLSLRPLLAWFRWRRGTMRTALAASAAPLIPAIPVVLAVSDEAAAAGEAAEAGGAQHVSGGNQATKGADDDRLAA